MVQGSIVAAVQEPLPVVIVGGGFGGLAAATALDGPARVIVIDRHNYMLFQPLLYQVATAALSPADVAAPIRPLLRSRKTETLLDEVIGVDLERSCIHTATGRKQIAFGWLVLATGARYNYFGHDEWARVAPALKTLNEAWQSAGACCWPSRKPRCATTRPSVAP